MIYKDQGIDNDFNTRYSEIFENNFPTFKIFLISKENGTS
jgi:hypothetical protein